MKIIKKTAHLPDILQAVILFGFALYFTGIVVSGLVYRYVHERHVPILLFSAAVLFIIGVLKLKRVMQESQPRTSFFNSGYSAAVFDCLERDVRLAHAGIFSFTVFAVALLGMVAVSGTEIRFSQFAYTDSIGGQSVIPFGDTSSSGTVDDTGASIDPATGSLATASGVSAIAKSKMQTEDGGIIMNDENFAQWLTDLYTKPDVWVGKKITAIGSVWKDGEIFEKNEFALARMMMTCCAADMQPVGVLAQWSDVPALIDGEWIEVTGTLAKKPYKDRFDPLILVETIKKIDPPQRGYIYP